MSQKTSRPAYRKRKGATRAQSADRHALYEQSVQCVESEIDMVDENFRKQRGRLASSLREDFCGTANTSCEWVRRRSSNLAIGIDTDTSVLDWGRANNLSQLEKEQEERITLLNDDVMSAETPDMDIIVAMNFSYQIFKTRDQLRQYFGRVYESLKSDGLFFLDIFGGYEAFREMEEATEFDDFTYIWDQHHYNPISGDITCLIHFKFPDGSKLKQAFRYEWRLWTLPELQELLAEAGFSKVLVYWEGTDADTGEGNGEYLPTEKGEADAGWICYVSAEK